MTAGPVLLQNDGVLPLAPGSRLAVVGPNGDDVAALLGDYVPPLRPGEGTSVLAGLRARYADVTFEAGCDLRAPVEGGLDRAAALAAAADVTVLVVGSSSARSYDDDFAENGAAAVGPRRAHATSGEGYDLADVKLPAAQRELAERVAATGTPVVAVVVSGRPLGIGRLAELCSAVLYAWYPGPEGGQATAALLSGEREPTGRLPVSLPRSSGTLPVAYNQRLETVARYIDAEASPLFPFGAGCGYATFALGAANVTGRYPDVGVTAELANRSDRSGTTVVQLYGRATGQAVVPRQGVLLGHAHVTLAAGAAAPVTVAVSPLALPGLGSPQSGELELWLSLDGPGRPAEPLRVPLGPSA
ncbi:MAG: glycoside hydrolase family 3 C-terminal domain-containing protein [Propionibacteriaceae bacterium]|nr:glycoside hydrolase family 3 C-terminal domain-containing protein [Propionibacteriaceae bacterium]